MREVGNRRYRLVRELGRGGMGAVWLGQDTVLGREVAVKELLLPHNVPATERAVYQERVLREARIASQLRDPAVVTVYDLISEDDQTFIVMELISAPTLDDLVERSGPLTPRAAAVLAGQLLAALEAAHSSGVVHRDVKPGNVMVPAKGTAKLTDFGIAQSLDAPRLTATGTLIGSPAYMSPDRLAGGDASPAWDLWALGATLFYAVEGRAAFERSTTSATIIAVMNERPLPQVTGPLGELITGLMEPDPARRMDAHRAQRLVERALAGTAPELTTPLGGSQPTARLSDARPRPKPTAVASGPVTRNPVTSSPVTPNRGNSGPVTPHRVSGPVPSPPVQPGPNTPPTGWGPHPVPAPPVPEPSPRKSKTGVILSATVLPLVLSGALVLLFVTVVRPWLASTDLTTGLGTGQTNGQQVNGQTDGRQGDGPVSSAAMQPVLTLGPDGDIQGDSLLSIPKACFTWVPAKGAPKMELKHKVGCYAPHDVELLAVVPATTKINEDVPYPGAEELTRVGGAGCTRKFLSGEVKGEDKEKSLRYWVVIPTAESWKVKTLSGYRVSNRMVYCFVGKADGSQVAEPIMKE
ncbi:Serine/threonine protein kinase [Lentzea fradiae]|uniref:non-specific serine/threonine protein kinase n=1 Tax=Lentzea fradiae TaxID=200378 RepID=A0A1G7R9Y6_9PSEU|nr:serine/threonine-protein kinase [Lentzea fradiae]SDG06790.1 Serine/threonine protein kinase [Lentzea fradiae]